MILTHIILILVNFTLAWLKLRISLVSLFSYVYILLFFVGSRQTVDLYSYVVNFDLVGHISGTQYLFYWPMNLCKDLNLDFYEFRLLYTCFALYMIDYLIRKIGVNRHYIIASYLGYLIFMDDIQIRNFFGSAFFCIASLHLLLHRNKWRQKFCIWTFLSTLVHTSFLVYFVLLLIPDNINDSIKNKFKNNILLKSTIVLFFVMTIFFLFNREMAQGIIAIGSYIDMERMDGYSKLATNWGGVAYMILDFITTIYSYYIYKMNIVKADKNTGNEESIILGVIFTINLLSVVFWPFVIFSIEFYRLLRNLILINVLGLSLGFQLSKNRITIFLMTISYLWIWFYITFLYNIDEFDRILAPIFNNNIYFNLL